MGLQSSHPTSNDSSKEIGYINKNYVLNDKDKKELIRVIYHIELDFFKNKLYQTMAQALYIVGSRPKHEGLIIQTEGNTLYTAQFAPNLIFFKENDWRTAILNIKGCAIHNNEGQTTIKQMVVLDKKRATMEDAYVLFKVFCRKDYSAIRNNCQSFCDYVINYFT